MIIIDQNKQGTPLIGICVSKAKRGFQRLVEERLERYPGDINLIRFHIENLDFENRQVKGDYFEKKSRRINQKKGSFPFPNVIFLQCHVEHKMVRKIEQLIGDKVFNNFIFDKWECWDLLERDNELRNHLPCTQRLGNETGLQQFLYNYEGIFLKPIDPTHGHSSKGIFRVKLQEEGNIEVVYQKKKKIQEQQFTSYQKFRDWISSEISTKPYIMQKGIQTVKSRERVMDIRLHMNKNGKGKWKVSALICRVATNGSHVNHRVAMVLEGNLGMAYLDKLISRAGGKMNHNNMERDIVNLGFKVCRSLDKSGYHMADIGIDIGLDENGQLWIFEVNPIPSPYHSIPYHAYTAPLKYAHYLATATQ